MFLFACDEGLVLIYAHGSQTKYTRAGARLLRRAGRICSVVSLCCYSCANVSLLFLRLSKPSYNAFMTTIFPTKENNLIDLFQPLSPTDAKACTRTNLRAVNYLR